ncbi:MAG: uracil-DNA glycosylase [Bdellovibrionota bacterium]
MSITDHSATPRDLPPLDQRVIKCQSCPRLVEWRSSISQKKRREYSDEMYWGRAVPSFGSLDSKILVVGLAPGAHGANRTGRMFTGDRSGQWLYRSLHRNQLATSDVYHSKEDGQQLHNTRITAVVRCAPPDNKPTTQEMHQCLPYLKEELSLMKSCNVIVVLGGFAWNALITQLLQLHGPVRPKPKFSHGAQVHIGPYYVLGCYHPSQQNTFTKKLTEPMLDDIFAQAKTLANV